MVAAQLRRPNPRPHKYRWGSCFAGVTMTLRAGLSLTAADNILKRFTDVLSAATTSSSLGADQGRRSCPPILPGSSIQSWAFQARIRLVPHSSSISRPHPLAHPLGQRVQGCCHRDRSRPPAVRSVSLQNANSSALRPMPRALSRVQSRSCRLTLSPPPIPWPRPLPIAEAGIERQDQFPESWSPPSRRPRRKYHLLKSLL